MLRNIFAAAKMFLAAMFSLNLMLRQCCCMTIPNTPFTVPLNRAEQIGCNLVNCSGRYTPILRFMGMGEEHIKAGGLDMCAICQSSI